jgi:hypothetical protein
MVQRTFPDGLHIPVDEEGATACLGVVERDAADGVATAFVRRPSDRDGRHPWRPI